MSKLYKVVVTGPFNAGKTTFVKTLADMGGVDTDRATSRRSETRVKSTTTVALDYGKVKLKRGIDIHLFGTPGQARFDFMQELLADGMHGFIFLIDSTDRGNLKQAVNLLASFKRRGNVPYLLAANKADQKGLSSAEIRAQLSLPQEEPITPCIATNIASARSVVEQLVTMIERAY